MDYTRDVLGNYTITGLMSEHDVLAVAEEILRRKLERQGFIGSPRDSAQFLRMRLGHLLHEEFHAVWLDNRHQVLGIEKLFTGSIDGASVHPREVVRSALRHNAAAVIFAHIHPSGNPVPSAADRAITKRLGDGTGRKTLNCSWLRACVCDSCAHGRWNSSKGTESYASNRAAWQARERSHLLAPLGGIPLVRARAIPLRSRWARTDLHTRSLAPY